MKLSLAIYAHKLQLDDEKLGKLKNAKKCAGGAVFAGHLLPGCRPAVFSKISEIEAISGVVREKCTGSRRAEPEVRRGVSKVGKLFFDHGFGSFESRFSILHAGVRKHGPR